MSTSVTALGGVTRVAVSTGQGAGNGNLLGIPFGCSQRPSILEPNGSVQQLLCAIPEVNPPSSYSSGFASYGQTWNQFQHIYACVSFAATTGTACTQTKGTCFANGSTCQFAFQTTAWNDNIAMFKYLIFEDITPPDPTNPNGRQTELSGYTVSYSP